MQDQIASVVRHNIVDILDEDEISVEFIEVAEQRTVSSRPEEDLSVSGPEKLSVRVQRNRVRRRRLSREAMSECNRLCALDCGCDAGKSHLELGLMLGRDGEMDARMAIAVRQKRAGFTQVLLEGRTSCIRVAVKWQQALGLGRQVQGPGAFQTRSTW